MEESHMKLALQEPQSHLLRHGVFLGDCTATQV